MVCHLMAHENEQYGTHAHTMQADVLWPHARPQGWQRVTNKGILVTQPPAVPFARAPGVTRRKRQRQPYACDCVDSKWSCLNQCCTGD